MKYFIIICTILLCAVKIDGDNLDDMQTFDEADIMTSLFSKLNWVIKQTSQLQKTLNTVRSLQSKNEKMRKSNMNTMKDNIKLMLERQDVGTAALINNLNSSLMENFNQKIKLLSNATSELKAEIEAKNTFDIRLFEENRQWQCILRRQDGSVNFTRKWLDYKQGFGSSNGEFFIGLEKLHIKTNYECPQELLIILQDFDNKTRYAKYDDFVVGSEEEKYKIKQLGNYHGSVGDSFSQHLGAAFSTIDQDNDNSDPIDCAKFFQSGWWFNNCYTSLLTAPYLNHSLIAAKEIGIEWNGWHGLKSSLQFVEMLIRGKCVGN